MSRQTGHGFNSFFAGTIGGERFTVPHARFFKKVVAREKAIATVRLRFQTEAGEFEPLTRQLFFVWLDNVFESD